MQQVTITVPETVHWIKEAFTGEPKPIGGSLNFKRCFDTGTNIGFNKEGSATTIITVITEACGDVKTAFPG